MPVKNAVRRTDTMGNLVLCLFELPFEILKELLFNITRLKFQDPLKQVSFLTLQYPDSRGHMTTNQFQDEKKHRDQGSNHSADGNQHLLVGPGLWRSIRGVDRSGDQGDQCGHGSGVLNAEARLVG